MSGYQPATVSAWLSGTGAESDIVVSSRVRLARNIAGFGFVGTADDRQRGQVQRLAREHILAADPDLDLLWLELTELRPIERRLLVERHLISDQHAKGDAPRAVAIDQPDEQLSLMVNEEDHLRLQVIAPGLQLRETFDRIDATDDRLEARLDFAFSPRFGYLTACPTNVGTGIRVSVMLHLPALKMTREIEKVRRAAKAMSLAVRGFHGEGSEAVGDFYQLSNQTTLGRSEREILDQFERNIIPEIIRYERSARRRLLEGRRVTLEDQVQRALATLRSARLMKLDESLQLISQLRLGIATELVGDVPLLRANELMLLTQPGHLQRRVGRPLDQAERRVERASLMRALLGEA